MKLLTTIYSKGENYAANVFRDDADLLNGKPAFWFFGDGDLDFDGSPRWKLDKPWGQADTSLHYNGQPINGDEVPGIVLPPELIKLTPEIVLGCFGTVELNGQFEPCIVFDVGPHNKLGELTPCLVRRLGRPDGLNDGIDEQILHYRWWPGVPANIDGKQFELKSLSKVK